jgi:pimeloyl-ACP methyl ester carboxylesterase
MPTPLLSLHGFTMNGAGLRRMLTCLEPRLADVLEFVYPDAPHVASAESVAGLASLMGGFRAKPPNLEWWNATADHLTYRGWDASKDMLQATARGLLQAERPSLGLFGFSQGAAVAATLAALSERGLFPALRFVVLVAGFLPRDRDIQGLFEIPIQIPSLHVWGSADGLARHSPKLLERFAPETRRVLTWDGRHAVPTNGAAADTLVDFLRQHA